jgi:hypothetical protein
MNFLYLPRWFYIALSRTVSASTDFKAGFYYIYRQIK